MHPSPGSIHHRPTGQLIAIGKVIDNSNQSWLISNDSLYILYHFIQDETTVAVVTSGGESEPDVWLIKSRSTSKARQQHRQKKKQDQMVHRWGSSGHLSASAMTSSSSSEWIEYHPSRDENLQPSRSCRRLKKKSRKQFPPPPPEFSCSSPETKSLFSLLSS